MAGPSILSTLSAAVLQTFGVHSAIEQPRYQVLERIGAVEVRQYDGRVVAEATVDGDEEAARNAGFRLIAGYIFGSNVSSAQIAMTAPVVQTGKGEPIAMTAPVAQQRTGGSWRIRFFMPSQYTLETLPKPKNPQVKLIPLPPQTYAVLAFSGSRAPAAVSRQQQRLAAAFGTGVWKVAGEPQSWFYDPPWTLPFLRLNEAAVPVERR
jgi:hypothetical protein